MVLSRSQIAEFEDIILKAFAKETFMENVAKCIGEVIEEKINNLIGKYQSEIENLRKENFELKENNVQMQKQLDKKIDAVEQYGRRKNLRFYGISENDNEDVAKLINEFVFKKIDIDMDINCIERCHRVGKKSDTGVRAIIVSFVSWKYRSKIFRGKSRLKGTKITIREDLTQVRINEMKVLVERYGRSNVWSADGTLFYKDASGIHKHIL